MANIVMLMVIFNPGCFLQTAVKPLRTYENKPSTKQRMKFDPTDWMDSVNEEPATPQPSRYWCIKRTIDFIFRFRNETSLTIHLFIF